MALETEADLHDTPTEQDDTYGTNQAEDKVAEVIHHSNW